jgi:transcriptional regulator with XRE-family HTH domain
MKLCEAYKCKRLALGMTQEEFGKVLGVPGTTISKFELGGEVSLPVFNCIKYGVENYIKSLDRDTYMETRLLESALCLKYLKGEDKLLTLNHMAVHIGKLNLELLKARTEEEL